MAAIGDLVATMRMNTKPFAADTTRAKGMLARLKTSTLSAMSSMGIGIGTMVAGGVAALAALSFAVASFIKAAIGAASEMEEVMNKFDVVFGESRIAMKKWSDDFASTMGRSKVQIAGFLSSVQDLFIPLGFSAEAATQMSKQVTQLALDLASFNNMADADVMRDLQAALTGSGEVMKKYGVIVSETAVKQELMAQGMTKKQANAASNVAKVQARLNIILRGTTAAQGDVIRSSASYENSLKALSAAWTDLKGEMGEMFLPVATAVVLALTGMIGVFKELQIVVLETVRAKARLVQVLTFFQSETINAFVDNLTHKLDELQTKSNKVSVGMNEAAIAIDAVGESAAETKRIMKELGDSIKAGFKADLSAISATRDVMLSIAAFGKPDFQRTALNLLSGGASIEEVQRYIEAAKELAALRKGAKTDTINKAAAKAAETARQAADARSESAAAAIRRSLETPLETYRRELEEIAGLKMVGALGADMAARAREKAFADFEFKTGEKSKIKQQQELPKAMERGSAEAWKKTIQAMYGTGKNKPAEQTAKNTERTAKAVEDLAQRDTAEATIP